MKGVILMANKEVVILEVTLSFEDNYQDWRRDLTFTGEGLEDRVKNTLKKLANTIIQYNQQQQTPGLKGVSLIAQLLEGSEERELLFEEVDTIKKEDGTINYGLTAIEVQKVIENIKIDVL